MRSHFIKCQRVDSNSGHLIKNQTKFKQTNETGVWLMSKSQPERLLYSCLPAYPTQSHDSSIVARPGLLAPTSHPCPLLDSVGHRETQCGLHCVFTETFSLAFIQPLRSERISPFKPPVSFLTLRKFQVWD